MRDTKEIIEYLIYYLKRLETIDPSQRMSIAMKIHDLYVSLNLFGMTKPKETKEVDLLPKSHTLRTVDRTKEIILSEALGMILAERSKSGEVHTEFDDQRLIFSVWSRRHHYSLFLHNKFLTEELVGGYNLVSNIEMTREEFVEFVGQIKERAINTMKRWDQPPNIHDREGE